MPELRHPADGFRPRLISIVRRRSYQRKAISSGGDGAHISSPLCASLGRVRCHLHDLREAGLYQHQRGPRLDGDQCCCLPRELGDDVHNESPRYEIVFRQGAFWVLAVAGVAAGGVDIFALLAYERGLRVTSLIIGGTATTLVLLVGFLILQEPLTGVRALAIGLIAVGIFLLQAQGG